MTRTTLEDVGLAVANIGNGRNWLEECVDRCVPSFHEARYQVLTEGFVRHN
jgi:hypothetical protein